LDGFKWKSLDMEDYEMTAWMSQCLLVMDSGLPIIVLVCQSESNKIQYF